MEAALRTASYVLTGENHDPDAFAGVRAGPGLREVTYEIAGISVRCAAVSGLGSARRQLIEQQKAGKAHYDFVEVMACPGGCVGGGQAPQREGGGTAPYRPQSLEYARANSLRCSVWIFSKRKRLNIF